MSNNNQPENMQDLLYKFIVLHESLVLEKQELAKRNAKLEQTIKDLDSQIKEFSKVSSDVNYEISDKVRKSVDTIAQEVSKKVNDSIEKETKYAINNFNRKAETAKEEIRDYRSNASMNVIILIVTMFVVSMSVALLITKMLMPEPKLNFTDKQLSTYQNGTYCDALFSKISDKDKKRLDAIITGAAKTLDVKSQKDNAQKDNTDTSSSDDDNTIYSSSYDDR